ncbi:hypothetical protein ACMD2_27115 [Ananas comosus]|uniref:Uncharacterized protein n=1 Tax=Ananas comosus TaxID=4615 RepID=A0A199VJW3_ANACO|nr:hypothetical protein ACMD2_27115 [Ananas comosus]
MLRGAAEQNFWLLGLRATW